MENFAILVLAVFVYFHVFYFISVWRNDFSLVDTAWGLGFVVVVMTGHIFSPLSTNVRILFIEFLTLVWALRLSGYIFYRSLKTGKEDFRYAQWREEWGEKANLIAYFKVYLLQALILLVVAYPLFIIHFFPSHGSGPTFWDILGVLIWGMGFFFEAVGDFQKNRFKSKPENRGKICQVGLWKYTRHPNYFGEAMIWWGVFFLALNHVPFYYIVGAPLIMHFLLLKVSGVAMLEKRYEGNPQFEEYKKRTNAFIPFFPRKTSL